MLHLWLHFALGLGLAVAGGLRQIAGRARLGEATDVAAEAIAKRFGQGGVDSRIRVHIVTVELSN